MKEFYKALDKVGDFVFHPVIAPFFWIPLAILIFGHQ